MKYCGRRVCAFPQAFGQTISIVGAVVLGQAAISAGLASPGMVIVVALTAIASFVIPTQPLSNTIRILRFPFMLLAASFGLIGIIVGFSLLTYHLCSLRSFGIPYLSPLAPLSFSDLKDTFIRAPIWKMRLRPRPMGYREPQRQNDNLRPHPPTIKGKNIRQEEEEEIMLDQGRISSVQLFLLLSLPKQPPHFSIPHLLL